MFPCRSGELGVWWVFIQIAGFHQKIPRIITSNRPGRHIPAARIQGRYDVLHTISAGYFTRLTHHNLGVFCQGKSGLVGTSLKEASSNQTRPFSTARQHASQRDHDPCPSGAGRATICRMQLLSNPPRIAAVSRHPTAFVWLRGVTYNAL